MDTGKKDAVSIAYMKTPERLADLINGYIYQGESIVKPEDIHELDRSEIRIRNTEERLDAQILERDVVCRICSERLYTGYFRKRRGDSDVKDAVTEKIEKVRVLIAALENQSAVHYGMPVRIMNEDAIRYEQQVKELRREHQKKKDIAGAEYLSGISKEDRLAPVITIVLYFGTEAWDGPKCLHDMLDLGEDDLAVKRWIADYPINLLEVRKFPDLEYFHTDLRQVFGFLQNEEYMQDLKQYIALNKEEFSSISEDAYDFIQVMSHSGKLKGVKEACIEERGKVNMCKAIDDMIKEGEEKGMNKMIYLTDCLLKENRINDLRRIATDKNYMNELLRKYQI